MKKVYKNVPISKIDILAGYQILGGIYGLGLTFFLFLNLVSFSLFFSIVILSATLLFAFSIFSGLSIFKDKRVGLKYSLINQYLQIFNFSIAGFGFKYISGLFVSIGIDLTNEFKFILKFGTSTWEIVFNQDSGINIVNFNIIPLILILFISKQLKKIEEQNLNNKLSEIGVIQIQQ